MLKITGQKFKHKQDNCIVSKYLIHHIPPDLPYDALRTHHICNIPLFNSYLLERGHKSGENVRKTQIKGHYTK